MADRATLYVLAGLPGSGKTSWAERLRLSEAPNALLLSSDDIRWVMAQGEKYKPGAERFVREVIHAYTRGCLMYGRSVIVDATNLTAHKRGELLWYAQEYGARSELHYIRVAAAESARRSAKWIPFTDITKLAKTFEHPDEAEGFDKLVIVDGENGWVRLT